MKKRSDTLGAIQAAASGNNEPDKGSYGGVASSEFFQNVRDDEKELAETKAKLEETEAELKRLEAQASTIIKSGSGEMFIRGQRASAAGLEIGEIKFEDMHQLASILFSMEKRIQLYIGDMLVKSTELNYGSVEEIASEFNLKAKTLYNWSSLCESVPITLRREVLDACPENPLTKSHYELVQKFHDQPDVQREYLMQAAKEGLSVTALRAKIHGTDNVDETEPEPSTLADKIYRKGILRIWRLVAHNRVKDIKDDEIQRIRKWLDEIEKKRK